MLLRVLHINRFMYYCLHMTFGHLEQFSTFSLFSLQLANMPVGCLQKENIDSHSSVTCLFTQAGEWISQSLFSMSVMVGVSREVKHLRSRVIFKARGQKMSLQF